MTIIDQITNELNIDIIIILLIEDNQFYIIITNYVVQNVDFLKQNLIFTK